MCGLTGPLQAVALYHKAGRISKALELCFKYNLFQVCPRAVKLA